MEKVGPIVTVLVPDYPMKEKAATDLLPVKREQHRSSQSSSYVEFLRSGYTNVGELETPAAGLCHTVFDAASVRFSGFKISQVSPAVFTQRGPSQRHGAQGVTSVKKYLLLQLISSRRAPSRLPMIDVAFRVRRAEDRWLPSPSWDLIPVRGTVTIGPTFPFRSIVMAFSPHHAQNPRVIQQLAKLYCGSIKRLANLFYV